MRVKLAARAAVPEKDGMRLHLGSASGMKIRLAIPKPIPVDPVVPSVELTEGDKELVRAARVHRELDRLVRDFSIFQSRAEILDPVIDLMQFNADGVLVNVTAIHNAVDAIVKADRSAVMTNESAKGF
jgi:hypothetical protein